MTVKELVAYLTGFPADAKVELLRAEFHEGGDQDGKISRTIASDIMMVQEEDGIVLLLDFEI